LNIRHDVSNFVSDICILAMKLSVWNIFGLSLKLTGQSDICDSSDYVDNIKSLSIIRLVEIWAQIYGLLSGYTCFDVVRPIPKKQNEIQLEYLFLLKISYFCMLKLYNWDLLVTLFIVTCYISS
jgi:hypothetical protein